MNKAAGPVLFALGMAACDQGAGAVPGTAVRDSAGIQIVENRGVIPSSGWTVDERPALEIGAQGPGTELYQVMSAYRARDGRIVVANTGTSHLRVYSPDGGLIRNTGGRGSGPGEFGSLFWVGPLAGDSIGAWDAALGRLTVLSPAGDVVRVVTPRVPLGMFPQALGVLPDGRVILASGAGPMTAPSPEPRVHRDTAAYVLLARTGEVQDTVGRFPGTEILTMAPAGGGFLMRPLPFGRQTVLAVRDGRIVIGKGGEDGVAEYEPGGRLRGLLRIAAEPVPVTPDDIEAYRNSLITFGAEGDAAFQRQQDELLRKAPYPRTMPPYTALQADPGGNLWMEQPRRPGNDSDAVWTVVAPDGRVRGSVRVPRGLNVKQIGDDWILGVALDADNVEHIRLHRILKR